MSTNAKTLRLGSKSSSMRAIVALIENILSDMTAAAGLTGRALVGAIDRRTRGQIGEDMLAAYVDLSEAGVTRRVWAVRAMVESVLEDLSRTPTATGLALLAGIPKRDLQAVGGDALARGYLELVRAS